MANFIQQKHTCVLIYLLNTDTGIHIQVMGGSAWEHVQVLKLGPVMDWLYFPTYTQLELITWEFPFQMGFFLWDVYSLPFFSQILKAHFYTGF